mgnify:CR=1 FL=1
MREESFAATFIRSFSGRSEGRLRSVRQAEFISPAREMGMRRYFLQTNHMDYQSRWKPRCANKESIEEVGIRTECEDQVDEFAWKRTKILPPGLLVAHCLLFFHSVRFELLQGEKLIEERRKQSPFASKKGSTCKAKTERENILPSFVECRVKELEARD